VLTGLTVLTADRMDTVDVIDGEVQTAQPVNLVNNLNSQHCPKPNAPAEGGRNHLPPLRMNGRGSLITTLRACSILSFWSHRAPEVQWSYLGSPSRTICW
jgi:hypothetical protein